MVESDRPLDVFLSYNRRDTGEAEAIASALRDRGIPVFFDRWSLTPGEGWMKALEGALIACRTAVIIIGPNGMSGWQRAESELALDRLRNGEDVVVIPLLLPGSDPPLGFLRLASWVDLRGGLTPGELDRLARNITARTAEQAPAICPYRGLQPFREEDAAFFFGRDEFVQRAVAAVHLRALTAVVGASGSGKSSAVRAGLLPRLRAEWDERSPQFLVVIPGDRPMHALAASIHALLEPGLGEVERLGAIRDLAERLLDGRLSLRDATDGIRGTGPARTRLLLFVDQWEELYTQCTDAAARTRFIDEILAAAGTDGVTVVFTVRADFFDDVLGHRPLADLLNGGVVNLAPMNRDELRSCIEQPAKQVGLRFETGLVERILDDVERGAGNLPLLEFVLTQLWRERKGDSLIHEAYTEMGEVRGAIARRADEEYGRLGEKEQRLVRSAMLQLVHTGQELADTRRRATRSEIGEDAWPVVLELAEARLLVVSRDDVTDEDVVEVAHEALILHWARLRAWLDADREFLLWRRRLDSALAEHASRPEDRGSLLRGALLAEALRWCGSRAGDLTAAERDFIGASARHARNLRVRRVLTVTALTGSAGALGLAAILLINSRREACRLEAARLLNTAASVSDPAIAALLVSHVRSCVDAAAGARIARRIADQAIPIAVLNRAAGELRAAAIAPDGTRVLTGYDDGATVLWPADGTGAPTVLADGGSDVRAVALDPTGRYALAVHTDEVRVWRVETGEPVAPWGEGGGIVSDVASAAFARNGSELLTAGSDGVVQVWRLDGRLPPEVHRTRSGPPRAVIGSPDGRWIAAIVGNDVDLIDRTSHGFAITLRGHTDRVVSCDFDSASGRLVTASLDGTVRLWDVPAGDGRIILRSADGAAAWHAEFDPGGRAIVASFQDGRVRLWRSDAAGRPPIEYAGHRDGVWTAHFSPDGERIASASGDGTAMLWRTDGPAKPIVLRGHGGSVSAVAFSADGSRLITASDDGTVRLWHGAGGSDPLVLRASAPTFAGVPTHDGAILALGGDDGVAWLWRTATAQGTPLREHEQGIRSIAFDATGERVVTASWDATARVWSVADVRALATLDAHHGAVAVAAFDPRGERIVTASDDGTVLLWTGEVYGEAQRLVRHQDLARDAVFSPDGTLVASASADGTAALSRVDGSGSPVFLRAHTGAVRTVAFSPEGDRLVTAADDSTAIVWNVASADTVVVLRGHQGWVRSARFDASGTRVVTASDDGTARVWSVEDPSAHDVLPGHAGAILSARFSSDGALVATGGIDSTARVYRLDQRSEPIVLGGHGGAVRDVFFTAGDSLLITLSEEGAAYVWRVGWPALQTHLSAATTLCLSPDQRAQFLREDADGAERAFRNCERGHGRL